MLIPKNYKNLFSNFKSLSSIKIKATSSQSISLCFQVVCQLFTCLITDSRRLPYSVDLNFFIVRAENYALFYPHQTGTSISLLFKGLLINMIIFTPFRYRASISSKYLTILYCRLLIQSPPSVPFFSWPCPSKACTMRAPSFTDICFVPPSPRPLSI